MKSELCSFCATTRIQKHHECSGQVGLLIQNKTTHSIRVYSIMQLTFMIGGESDGRVARVSL